MLISGRSRFHPLLKSPAPKTHFRLFLSLCKEVKNKTAPREGVYTSASKLPNPQSSSNSCSIPESLLPPTAISVGQGHRIYLTSLWTLQRTWKIVCRTPHLHPSLPTGMGFLGSGTMRTILLPCISGRWHPGRLTAAIPFCPLVMTWGSGEHRQGGAIAGLRKAWHQRLSAWILAD